MKKKIFGGIAVLAIAAVAAWNVNLDSKTNGMSDVKLVNVEALADETIANANSNIYCCSPYTNICIISHGIKVMGVSRSIPCLN